MSIYRRPDSPFWWMVLEANGQRKSTGIPVNAGSPAQNREQERQARNVYALAQARATLASETTQKPIISFTDWARWFETHQIAHHRGIDKERSMLRQLVEHFRRFRSLADIHDTDIKEWKTTRSTAVSRNTVNREMDVLRSLLRAAVPKYLDRSPAVGVEPFRTVESEPRVLTLEEEARLVAICSPIDLAWLYIALDTLIRLSNVVNLEWPQVKFDRRVILPLNAKVSTKDKPITSRMSVALKRLERSPRYVFPHFHEGAGRTAAKNRIIRRFEELCHAAGIPHGRAIGGLTFHCLRHTGATRALQNGASLRTVMELGGWKDFKSVLRYLHAADVDVRAAAESIGAGHVPLTSPGNALE